MDVLHFHGAYKKVEGPPIWQKVSLSEAFLSPLFNLSLIVLVLHHG